MDTSTNVHTYTGADEDRCESEEFIFCHSSSSENEPVSDKLSPNTPQMNWSAILSKAIIDGTLSQQTYISICERSYVLVTYQTLAY